MSIVLQFAENSRATEAVMKHDKYKTFSVHAEAANLTRIRDFAIKYGEKFGFNMRQLNGYKLSLDEICTNIIRYAYNGMKRGDIRIEIIKQKDRVTTRIIDTGVAFDYNTVLNPDLDRYVREKRKGGFGIYLVRQLNDEVRYERIGDTNVLTLANTVEPKPKLIDQIKQNFTPSGMTIRFRFTIVATLIISCVSVGTFFIATFSQKRMFSRQVVNSYAALIKGFASSTSDYILDERQLLITEQIFKLIEDEPAIVRLTVIDRNGIVTADSTVTNIGTLYHPPTGVASLIEQNELIDEYVDPTYRDCVYIAVPIRIAGAVIGKVFSSIEKDAVNKAVAVRMNRERIVLYMVAFWIIGIIGISFMGNMFVTPIKKITEEINRVGKEGTAGSFHYAGFGEFAEISTAFNRMMREIKQSQVRLTDQARLKREMQLAQNIQQTLLPRQVPESEGFEIAAKYNAAMEVGGDYYDFFYVDENSTGIVVGDVSGKGVGGAFVMSPEAAQCDTGWGVQEGDVYYPLLCHTRFKKTGRKLRECRTYADGTLPV
jgi:serine/threonine-protein kinase RsbW